MLEGKVTYLEAQLDSLRRELSQVESEITAPVRSNGATRG